MYRSILRPAPLKSGDLVRIISPSFPALALVANRKTRAEKALEKLGLRVDYGTHAFEAWGHLAGSPQRRAADINSAFADQSVSGILCALGGGNSNDLLPFLDYDVIAGNPKPFIGHSDNMVLMMAMLAKANLITFHGPSFINQMGEFPEPFSETLSSFRAACMSTDRLNFIPMDKRTDVLSSWWFDEKDMTQRLFNLRGNWRWLVPGAARGPIIGGHLIIMMNVLGTQWEPPLEDIILFWDVMDRLSPNPSTIDGALGELARRGILTKIAGLVVGYPARLNSPHWVGTMDEVIMKWSKEIHGPILVDADCGHTDPVWTIPYGSIGSLDSYTNTFSCDPGTQSPNSG